MALGTLLLSCMIGAISVVLTAFSGGSLLEMFGSYVGTSLIAFGLLLTALMVSHSETVG